MKNSKSRIVFKNYTLWHFTDHFFVILFIIKISFKLWYLWFYSINWTFNQYFYNWSLKKFLVTFHFAIWILISWSQFPNFTKIRRHLRLIWYQKIRIIFWNSKMNLSQKLINFMASATTTNVKKFIISIWMAEGLNLLRIHSVCSISNIQKNWEST